MRMKYYAMVDDRQVGPYTLDELMEAGIGPDTYVWCKGMADWERADDNADICRYYRQRLSRLQHPQPATPVTPAAGEAEPQEEGMVYPDLSELPDLAAHDPSVPPPPGLMAAAIAVTVLCFPPTGIAAIYYARKAAQEWKKSRGRESAEAVRYAKMWTGVSLSIGFLCYATLIRLL